LFTRKEVGLCDRTVVYYAATGSKRSEFERVSRCVVFHRRARYRLWKRVRLCDRLRSDDGLLVEIVHLREGSRSRETLSRQDGVTGFWWSARL